MLKMKKRRLKRKGISPMVATVLLIGFIIAIILLIFLWGKNYIEELAEKRGLLAEKQQECTRVSLDVVKSCWSGGSGEIVIKNKADIPVHKFVFRAVGSSAGEPDEVTSKLGGLEIKSYTFAYDETAVGVPNNVEIIPHLRVAIGHYVPCSNQKITARLSC